MANTKKRQRITREYPENSKKFFWVLLIFVLVIGIWIGVQGANQGMLTLATSAQGLTNQDGDMKVRIHALDALKPDESLYTVDQTAVVKDGQLKLRWQIPDTAKKRAAYIEICALDKTSAASNSVKKACIDANDGPAYNKVSCPYYVPANSTGVTGQLWGWNKLDDSQKVGCGSGRGFSSRTSSLQQLVQAQSPAIQVDGGGVLVAEDGKIQAKNVEDFVKEALDTQSNSVVYITNNLGTPGPQGQAGAAGANGLNGADGLDGAAGIATVSGGGLVLTGSNLSLDPSCLGGQVLQWDGSNWGCASVAGTDSQTLSLAANVLAISGGNSVNLSGYLDNTDSQALSWVSGTRTLSLTGGGSVVISDTDTTYSAGNGLSLGGTTFSINSPTCAGTTKLTWNGSAFSCAADVDTDTDTTNFNIAAQGTGGSQNIASGDTVTFNNGTGTTATRSGGTVTYSLNNTAVSAGTYSPGDNANGSLALPQFTVDAQGRLTAASTTNVTLTGISNSQLANSGITVNTAGGLTGGSSVSLGGSINLSLDLSDSGDGATVTTNSGSGLEVSGGEIGLIRGCSNTQLLKWNSTSLRWECASDVDTDTNSGGTVTSITAGTGLTGGTITTSGTINIASTGVTAATYGSSTSIPVITVNAQGQITAASSTAIPIADTSITGLLTDTDWDTFNGKENVLTFNGNGLFSRSGNTITGLACAADQIPKWTAGTFICGTDIDTDTTYSAGNGLSLGGTTFSINSPTCAGTTKLTWSGTAFSCAADVDTDTDTTNFNVAAQGTVGSQNIASGDTVTFNNGTGTTATRSGSTVTYGLNNTAVSAGTYSPSDNANGSLALPQFTVDAQGRLTAASTTNVTLTGIANSQLTNSAITVNTAGGLTGGSSVSLGGSINLSLDLSDSGDSTTATTNSGSGLEVSGGEIGLIRGCSSNQLLKWNSTSLRWECASDTDTDTDTGVTSVGTIDSQAKSANGAVISGTVVYLQTADVSNPGLVSTGTQTFAGNKTFNGNVIADANLTVNGDVVLGNAASDAITFTGEVRGASPLAFEGATNDGVYTTFAITDPTIARTITFPDASGTVCLQGSSSCAFISTTLANGQIIIGNGSNVATAVTPSGDVTISNTGVTTIGANSVALTTDTTGNYVADVAAGTGISIGGSLGEGWTPTINLANTAVSAGAYAPADNANGSIAIPQFTVDAQGRLTAASTANITPTGIANAQLANSSLTITAGAGLANGGAVSLGGTVALDIGAGNGITVNANDITIDLTAATDALSATTSSSSGLEVLSTGLTLLQGCSDGQLLKWNEATDVWGCSVDIDTDTGVTTIGTINSQTKSANGAVISGNTLVLQTADASFPGLVSTGTQTFAGAKTFTDTTTIQTAVDGNALLVKNSSGGSVFTVETSTGYAFATLGSTGLDSMFTLLDNASNTYLSAGSFTGSSFFNFLGDSAAFADAGGNPTLTIDGIGRDISVGGGADSVFRVVDAAGLFNILEVHTTSGGILATATDIFQVLDGTASAFLISANGTNGRVAVGSDAQLANYKFEVAGDINISSGSVYRANGTAGLSSVTCSGGQFLQNQNIRAGLTTAGTCANGGVNTVGTFSGSSIANGASISGTTITFGPADATNPGMVSTGTQTFAGNKTLTGATTISGTGASTKFRVLDSGGFSVLNVSTSGSGAVTIGASGGNAPVFTVRNNSQNVFVVNSLANTLTSNIGSIDFQNTTGTTSLLSIDEGTGAVGIGIGPGGASYPLDVIGEINTDTGYRVAGTAGANTTCSGGQVLQNLVATGGIVTAGTCAADAGVVSIGTIDSQTKSVNGAVISGTSLVLQTADASFPGLVSTGTQTFAGNKTFTGTTLFQNTSDSVNSLQVKNTAGEQIINVDTATNNNLITNSSFEVNTTGWVGKGGGSITQNTSHKYSGNASAAVSTAFTYNRGTSYSYALASSTTYTFSGYVKSNTNSSISLNMGYSEDGSTDTICTSVSVPNNTTWTRFVCTFTTGTTSGSPYVYVTRSTGGLVSGFYLDGVTLKAESVASPFGIGGLSFNGFITSPIALKNQEDSDTAFTVQSSDNSNLISVDTRFKDVNIGGDSTGIFVNFDTDFRYVSIDTQGTGGLTVYDGVGGSGFGYDASGASFSTNVDSFVVTDISGAISGISFDGTTGNVGIGLGVGSANYKLDVAGDINISTGSVYRVNGTAGATTTCSGGQILLNPVLQGGLTTAGTCTSGAVTSIGTIDSQTKSANGAVISGNTLVMQTADASFPGLVSTGTQSFAGNKTFTGNIITNGSLQVDGSTTLGDATTDTITAKGSMIANASATATADTTSGTGTNTTTVTITGTSFANGDVILIDNVGQDYYTRVTAGGGTSSLTVSPAVTFETGRTVTKYNIQNIGATDSDYTTASNRFFQGYFLGGVVTGAGSTTLSDGRLHSTVGLNFDAPSYTFTNTSDSTSAFRVNKANGDSLVNFDTSTTENLLSNGNFEANTTGWVAHGSSTVSQTTSQKYLGSGSMSVATTAAANDGAKFNYALASQTSYTMTFYVKNSLLTSAVSTINIGRSEDGSTDTNCATGQTINGAGWSKITCTFTTGNVTGTDYIYIKQTDAVARTLYVDSVQLQTSTNIVSNPDVEVNTSGWGYYGAPTLSQTSSQFYTGAGSLQVDTSLSASSEGPAQNTFTAQPNTTYTFSAMVMLDAGTGSNKTFSVLKRLDNIDSGSGSSCTSASLTPGTWTNMTCTFTTGSIADNNPFVSINVTDDGVTPITFYVDNASLAVTKWNSNDVGRISLNGSIDSPLTVRGAQDSVSALQVQQQNGKTVFNVDTLNGRVGIGTDTPTKTLQVDGKAVIKATSSDTDTFEILGTATSNNVALRVGANSRAVSVGASTNTSNASLSVYGTSLINTKINSGSAFRIQDASGITALSFATTSGNRQLTIGGTGTGNDGKLVVANSSGNAVIDLDSTGTGAVQFTSDYFNIATSGGSNIYLDPNLFSVSGNQGSITLDGTDGTVSLISGTGQGLVVDGASGNVTIGSISPTYKLNVAGDINISTGSVYRVNGTAGATTTCSGGQILLNPVLQGGLTTAGTCTSGAVTSIGTIDSQTKSANGAVISGNTLVMQTADATYPGLVSTGTQTFAGAKTFSSTATFSGNIHTGNGIIQSTVADGAGANAFQFNTSNNYTTSGADLLVVSNWGVEKMSVDKDGNLNIASGAIYKINGTSGVSTTCSGGQFLQDQVVLGGLTTGGTCSGTVVTSIGTINSQTKSANGAVISGNNLVMQTADTSFPGLVSTGTQTFAGNKTFNGDVEIFGSSINLGNNAADTITATANLRASNFATATTDTTSGTGTNTTTLTIVGTSFANNDVVLIDNAGQDYYTRVVSGGGTSTLTVSPAVTFETGRTVTKYTIQNIGATPTDYTTQSNRFFQGYFLGGVVTGSGSTTLSDGLVSSTGGTLNLYGGGANGASAIGLIVNTPSYTTSGAKLVSFQNNNVEKFSVDKDGTIDGTGNLTIDGNATLGDGDGVLQSWTSTVGPGVSRSESGYAAANGYVYAIGGAGGSTSVYYTKINADGSLGTWQTTASLGTSRDQLTAAAANGYVYAIGGNGLSSVEYAKINADGSLGAWQTTSSTNSNRSRASATVANGYVYIVGSTLNATTEYAKINADGSLGAWTVGSSLGVQRYGNATVATNGYIYAIGGNTGLDSAVAEYATLNPTTGAIGTWTSTTSMNNARNITRGVVANGHIYISGGFNVDTTEYTSINSDGTLDAWQTGPVMTDTRWGHGMITANGYIYSISGDGTTTAESTSIPRTKISGALDLVGFDPGSLGVSGSGGSLTAGNTMIVGTLDVQDRANFLQGVSVGQHLSVAGDFALAGALVVNSCTNTSTNILCAGGNTRAADITIGTNDNNALIFETNNTAVGRFTNTGELLINTATNTLNAQLVVNSTAGKDTGMNIIGNVNSFYQINIQNTNSGASASSDFVATANNGTATTYYVDFGINGSGGGAAPFTGANDAYLYASDSNNLHIGALGSSGALKFYTTGGTSSPVQRLSINASGQAVFDAVNSSGTGYTFNANSVTTGTALQVNATSLTTGLAFQVVGPGGKNLLRIKNDTAMPLDDEYVIIGEGGISAAKPDSLARDQLYVFGRINSSWNMFTQDFLSGNPAVAADGLFMNGYYDENIGTGGTSPSGQIQMQNTTGASGMARLTFTGTLGTGPWASNWGTGGNLVTERSLNPVFEARVQATSNTDVRHIVGFTDMALNATTSADTNNSANEVFFRKTAAGTNWEAVSRNGSGTEEVTTLATACAGSTACTTAALRTMRIELENVGANGTARFYIDGTLVATHTTTAVPANTNRLGWLLTNTPTTTTYSGRTLDMDYVRVWSDDPPDSVAPEGISGGDGLDTTIEQTQVIDSGDTPPPEDNSNEALLERIKTLESDVDDLGQYKDVLTTETLGDASSKKAIFIADVEFRKQVEFSADALFKANVNVDGTLNANGRVVVSNNTGTITMQPGQTEIQVLFAKPLIGKPNVFLSTENPDVKVVAQTRTANGFIIKLSEPITEPLDVQWFAVEKE